VNRLLSIFTFPFRWIVASFWRAHADHLRREVSRVLEQTVPKLVARELRRHENWSVHGRRIRREVTVALRETFPTLAYRDRRNLIVFHWHAEAGEYEVADFGGFQTRNQATTKLLGQAVEIAAPRLRRSFSIEILTDDFPNPDDSGKPRLAYCRSKEPGPIVAIPDFLFWGWPEAGIDDYEETVARILEEAALPPADDRMFWIGNPATHPTRQRLLELARDDKRIDAQAMGWQSPQMEADVPGAAWTPTGGFLSIPQHCRYRVLIDMQGRGFSSRLKLLLFCRRPLLIQDRPWHEYYFFDLKPFVHYIPVQEDLSDLSSRLDWIDAHKAEADAIALEGQRFAQTRLRRRHAVQYLADCLVACSER